ncbi:hypothetical protein ECE50_022745 [Chitinophaga sp. Mgbs1]|uniref:Uncharacterized protein n=1 Tax=Chitinophaga solisilvae TaxID=1233460 RepID=A0A3S1JHI4_9BACT|nr:hypothetical protein [Chitinophaga solisilvae]
MAGKLGNTRAVCKKYYIHPQLLDSYENGTLTPWLQKIRLKREQPAYGGLHADEKCCWRF